MHEYYRIAVAVLDYARAIVWLGYVQRRPRQCGVKIRRVPRCEHGFATLAEDSFRERGAHEAAANDERTHLYQLPKIESVGCNDTC